MEQTPNGMLALNTSDVWKGGATHNGTLLKIHDNSFTVGYSAITAAVGVPAKFGYAVWYDAALKNNAITTVKPAGVGAKPVLAGILVRSPSIASGYPAANDTVDTYNKGLVAKQGFMVYKTGTDDTPAEQDFSDVEVGMIAATNDLNGKVGFFATLPLAGFTKVGDVIMVNPDDNSWLVKIAVI